ncbi:Haloacid dehalogenase OS=Streptomyces gougerotii OX=53448 GN=GCM10010227_13010 PE=4 SV=1 [Streptomyces diastaticus subsp. diastaticus]
MGHRGSRPHRARLPAARHAAPMLGRMMRAVVLDVGECLVDETRRCAAWADRLGVPPHTFSAVLGAVRAAGGGFEDACAVVRPGFDASAGRAARAEAGAPQDTYTEADLYADVRPALAALRADGLMVGVADNLTAHGADMLRGLLAEEIELVAASEEWGAAKPDPAFFRRLAGSLPFAPGEILYVGDRWPYDIRPAAEAGLRTALVRRGPWAVLDWESEEARTLPDFRIGGLLELSGLILNANAGGAGTSAQSSTEG